MERPSMLRPASVWLAVAAASALGGCGAGEAAAPRDQTVARGNPAAARPALSALQRRPGPEDRWPSFAQDNRPGDALIVDRDAGRRLFTAGTARYGLWLTPARLTTAASPAMTDVCLRVIPLVGRDRGGGGSACASGDAFRRDPRLLVTLLVDGPRQRARRRPAVVAGTVPDGVARVRLVRRHGRPLVQPVRDNVFAFEADTGARELRYRTPQGAIEVPIRWK